MAEMPEIFIRYAPYIEKELKSLFKGRDLYLYDMMKYHMGWIDKSGRESRDANSGKMLRGTLSLLASESVSGDFKRALPVSAAIELIHNYSLIHDDIQDEDELRRHRPTVWKVWGASQAINAGSALKVLAGLSVLRLGRRGMPGQKQAEVLDILESNCLEMLEGQYMDIDFEHRDRVSVEQYIKMIEKKTAALISGALEAGAVLYLEREKLDSFERFGKYLGIAFQIIDDILGIWGKDGRTGKPQGSDIRKRKKSLPIVFFIQEYGRKKSSELFRIYKEKSIDDGNVATVLGFLEKAGARDYCREQAEKYYRMALNEMESLPIKKEFVGRYSQLAEFLIKRDF
ncbi:MAG: polyprenyl synthetase family protein [Actinomycetia bacterium]|nr:polyprenyl synthetase family protein [Actinomycetes bacterium]